MIERVQVINCDLFSGQDLTQGKDDHKTIDHPDVRVRLAGMVDILRFVPADTSINVIIRIQLRDVLASGPGRSPHGFGMGDSFPRVLCYGAVLWKMDRRETTETTNRRFHN